MGLLRYYINRLKRTYGIDSVLPLSTDVNKAVKPKQYKEIAPKEYEEIEIEKLDVGITSHSQKLSIESEESDRSDEDIISSSHRCREDPEWTPGSSYLQRKLQSSNPADDVAHRLRSRLVNRSGRETGTDREQAGVVRSPGSEHMIVTTQVIRRLARLSLC